MVFPLWSISMGCSVNRLPKSNCPWIALVNAIRLQCIVLTYYFIEGNVIMAMAVI